MYLILNIKTNNFHVSSILIIGKDEMYIKDFDITKHFLDFNEYYYYDSVSKTFLFNDTKYQDFLNNEYSRLREIEYKKLNQDELRYDDFVNNTTVWIDTITLIKIKYPKPIKVN